MKLPNITNLFLSGILYILCTMFITPYFGFSCRLSNFDPFPTDAFRLFSWFSGHRKQWSPVTEFLLGLGSACTAYPYQNLRGGVGMIMDFESQAAFWFLPQAG